VFRGKVVDIGAKHLTLEISGPEKKVEAFIDLMKPYGICEVARTGRIAIARGE
jgi:acetolactate synthase-1/3 small subunit